MRKNRLDLENLEASLVEGRKGEGERKVDHLDKDVGRWLRDLEVPRKALTKWEEEFVESVREQWEEGKGLSERQREVLEGLAERKG